MADQKIAETWRQAAIIYRERKFREIAGKARDAALKAAQELEEWIASSEGQAGLELLDAASESIVVGETDDDSELWALLTGDGFRAEDLEESDDEEDIIADPHEINAYEFIRAAVGNAGKLKDQEPTAVLPYLKERLNEIANKATTA